MDSYVEAFISGFRTEQLDVFFYNATLLGGEYTALLIIPVLAFVAYGCAHCRKNALAVISAVVGAEIVKQIIKHIVMRPRPLAIPIALGLENDSSFPSGHATFAVACYGTITYLLIKKLKHPAQRILVLCAGVLIIAVIALSRLYLRVHYASDIVAGLCLGFVSMLIALYSAKRIEKIYDSILSR